MIFWLPVIKRNCSNKKNYFWSLHRGRYGKYEIKNTNSSFWLDKRAMEPGFCLVEPE